MSSAYLRLSIFMLAILISACVSSSPAILMTYSSYKLNKLGDNIQPCRTPFPIWNQSVVPCPVLTVVFWCAYRFLKRQVRWFDVPISFRFVWVWVLGYKESWVLKNWCLWTAVLEKTLERLLDCKEIQPVHPKDQSWVFIGRSDVEAETPVLRPPDEKSWLLWKDPDPGKDWAQEKRMTEDEVIGWHHQLNGHEFEWTLGVDDGQGGLECCGSGDCKESDMTEQLNWTEAFLHFFHNETSNINIVCRKIKEGILWFFYPFLRSLSLKKY